MQRRGLSEIGAGSRLTQLEIDVGDFA